MRQQNDPNNPVPKSSRGKKYKEIIKPIWEKSKTVTGKGLDSGSNTSTIILPSDPNALIKRLRLLLASKEADNTGVINELVSIGDELFKQKIINNEQYQMLQSKI